MLIQRIKEMHRRRQDMHRAEKSLTLQAKAICRRICNGDKEQANALFSETLKGSHPKVYALIEPYLQSINLFSQQRSEIEKRLEQDAKQLPIAEHIKSVSGLGWGSAAAIIGEAGDLSQYPKKGHLWKRMGLAVINGERQRKKANAVDALIQGYNPVRRSIMWVVGDCIIRSQSERFDKQTGQVKKEAGPLRKTYDARKAYELERGIPTGHAHNRAKRYMEKKILKDMWQAWNQSNANA